MLTAETCLLEAGRRGESVSNRGDPIFSAWPKAPRAIVAQAARGDWITGDHEFFKLRILGRHETKCA
ncbi:TPA: hypothetical protein DCY67_05495 [Candidatus Acetothermia bacterium]|nr:hypothetical protein [Candidatus Acetothermia bacterium]